MGKDCISYAKWEALLKSVKASLKSQELDFSDKANIALSMLEESLDALADYGLLKRVAVEFEATTSAGVHLVHKYSLASKVLDEDEGEEVTYIKKSRLEEDE